MRKLLFRLINLKSIPLINNKLQLVLSALLVLTTYFLGKTIPIKKAIEASMNNSCCIDTFKLKYQIALTGDKVRSVDENIYVGILKEINLIGKETYRKMVFGDNINSVIALVRQDEESLNFIRVLDKDAIREEPLLCFTRNIGDKWKVHIEGSYFWRKEITFEGIEYIEKEEAYIYNVETDKDYTSLGNELSKIYYSKEKGFLRFIFKTHWISVEANKQKNIN